MADGELQSVAIDESEPVALRIVDDDFLLLLNAAPEDVDFTIPDVVYGRTWLTVANTDDDTDASSRQSGETITVRARCVVVLVNPRGE